LENKRSALRQPDQIRVALCLIRSTIARNMAPAPGYPAFDRL